MLIKDIMVRDVATVMETDTLEHAAILLERGRFRHLPVAQLLPQAPTLEPALKHFQYPPPKPPVAVVGILSDRDMPGGRVGAAPLEELRGRQAHEVMRRPVITASPETPVEYAAQLMADNAIGCLPVVDDAAQGRLVGIITESDLFHALVRLVGAQEPSTRLRLMLRGGDPAHLASALMIVAQHEGRLAGVLAEPVDAQGRWPVTLRVRTIYPGPLLHDLEAAGIEVEQPAEGKQQ
ncbi:MAG TPA: CBS domain-containing protein [Ktedonobacterales bacterium]|jgi:acetoin utilization protein AcuB